MACRDREAPPLVAQVDGEFPIAGLSAPVRIVRDRWGIPHIYAQSQADLFVAQGFVQAQDRLFQMDLWRRSSQGRLAQVLGPLFAERDIMTRRMQYRGDREAEWASYGPDTRAIAGAFIRGINAWVEVARERPPEEFRLAGWKPEFWHAADLLNRTDAFLQSADAIAEVERRGLSFIVADAIRRVGVPPFFIGFAAPVYGADDEPEARAAVAPRLSDDESAARRRVRTPGHAAVAADGTLRFSESRTLLDHPGSRYLVHLQAPNWNVIGATAPWLPGVAIGHNERVAWGMAPYEADTQDVYLEPLADPAHTTLKDVVVMSTRRSPFEYESVLTPRGMVVATDREKHVAFTVRWSGAEPGAAAELAALALNRARNWTDFRAALARWKMPVRHFVYADADGNAGSQVAGLIPVRRGSEWQGYLTIDDLPHAFNPPQPPSATDAQARGAADPEAMFAHVLAINDAAKRRFNVGPLPRPEDDGQIRGVMDPRNWDRSLVAAAPGQSGSPSSAHFSDLAGIWSRGEMVPLAFSEAEVQAGATSTLTLVPRR